MRQLEEKQLTYDTKTALKVLAQLTNDHEKNLFRTLARYSITLQTAAMNYEPHLLAHYLKELANDFHALLQRPPIFNRR